MIRENRYMVFKLSDVDNLLSDEQKQQLCLIAADIDFARQQHNRGLLSAVVIEKDWPEYEPVWAMLEKRVDG